MNKIFTTLLAIALTANLFAQTQQKQPDKLKPYVGSRLVVTGEQLRRAGEMNIITSLRNIDPSFRVIENSKAGSEPNTLPEIQLRGQTGAQTASPLFILDGVEVSLQRIADLDPAIVERVVLLKDASDKSRYGIKGGQGVVEVYTNRPSSQRVSVRYNGFMNIQSADLSSYNLCNAREKLVAEMLSGLGRYNGNSQNIVPLDERYINLMKKVDEGLDIDWLSLPLRKSVSQRHNLAVDGTLNRFSYGANFNYDDQQGVMKGSNNRNMQGTLFLDYKWNKLQINNQFNYTDKLGNFSPYGTFDLYGQMNPYFDPYDENGNLVRYFEDGSFSQYNPLWDATTDSESKITHTNISDVFNAKWLISNNFALNGKFGYSKLDYNITEYLANEHSSQQELPLMERGSYVVMKMSEEDIVADLNGNYHLERDKHLLTAHLGINWNRTQSNWEQISINGFTNKPESFPTANKNKGTLDIFSAEAFLNYSFDNRYAFYGNYRFSNASQTALDNASGSFWSIGASWAIQNELFMKNMNWLHGLQIRASYGHVGVLENLDPAQVQWQNRKEANVGIDLSVLQGMISGRFDYYDNRTKDAYGLTYENLPETGLDQTPTVLKAQTKSCGYEAFLNIRPINNSERKFYLNIFGGLVSNRSTIEKVSNAITGTTTEKSFDKNMPINSLIVAKSMGVDPSTGREVFINKEGGQTFDPNTAAQVIVGDKLPKLTGNMGLNAEFFGVGVDVIFTWNSRYVLLNNTLVGRITKADPHFNLDKRVLTNRWQKPGDMSQLPSYNPDDVVNSSIYVQENRNLTLSQLSVYYDFKNGGVIKTDKVSGCKVRFSMSDAFANFNRMGALYERGINYPFAKNYSISLLLAF